MEAVYEKLLVNVEEESPLGVTLTSLEAPLLPLITNTYPVPLYKIDASALSVALLIESLNCVSVVLAVDVTVIEELEFAVKVSFYDAGNALKRTTIYNYKNNDGYRTTDGLFMANGEIRNSAVIDVWIEDVSVNDYFEVYALGDTTDSATSNVEGGTRFDTTFSGFKLA